MEGLIKQYNVGLPGEPSVNAPCNYQLLAND